ncbi:hypothetical protein BDV29DRAFT_173567 [Aspergillus leporis]|uniref:Uncharacterized protein n=1 Tax=Aspergillus leporis TaxID=41062 RepID=A0A5N5X381_9EURO|nr:hypothetical protein BDV29DRAFT_173567 [Aspergillus leporis]
MTRTLTLVRSTLSHPRGLRSRKADLSMLFKQPLNPRASRFGILLALSVCHYPLPFHTKSNTKMKAQCEFRVQKNKGNSDRNNCHQSSPGFRK